MNKFIVIFMIFILSIMCSFNFDTSFEGDLQTLLDSETHSQLYQPNIFDCTEMTCETQTFLIAHGYDTKIAYSTWARDPTQGHVWVLVYNADGKQINIESALDSKMGFITYEKKYNPIDMIFENETEMRAYGIY